MQISFRYTVDTVNGKKFHHFIVVDKNEEYVSTFMGETREIAKNNAKMALNLLGKFKVISDQDVTEGQKFLESLS
jgi:hypothetical protein